MAPRMKTITDVAAYQLCSGCGVCAYAEPQRFAMIDTLEHGRRPTVRVGAPAETGEALRICPGAQLRQTANPNHPDDLLGTALAWGPVRSVWEGYAADKEVRFAGSSGGAATAIALFCLERGDMTGVLHSSARRDVAYLNETVLSQSREDLLSATGSRYAPASPCDGLAKVECASGRIAFIGKPCDVAAVCEASKFNATLASKIGVTIAFFCAGVPSTKGTIDLLRKSGVENEGRVRALRYRGNGWPGAWTARYLGPTLEESTIEISYEKSWDYLQRYRHWRCYICPDHTGEFADIAVGDPWDREPARGDLGHSLIIARTPRGEKLIKDAAAAGYLVLEREDKDLLPRSQPNLLTARGALWGRLLALRLFGAPVPKFHGFPLLRFWWRLSLKEKRSSILGTIKRVYVKRLKSRIAYEGWRG